MVNYLTFDALNYGAMHYVFCKDVVWHYVKIILFNINKTLCHNLLYINANVVIQELCCDTYMIYVDVHNSTHKRLTLLQWGEMYSSGNAYKN